MVSPPASTVRQPPSCPSVSLTLTTSFVLPLPVSLSSHLSHLRGGRRSVLWYPAWWRWQAARGEHCNWYVVITPSDKTCPDHARLNGGQLSRRRWAQSSKEAKNVSGRFPPSCGLRVLRAAFRLQSSSYMRRCWFLQTLMKFSDDAAGSNGSCTLFATTSAEDATFPTDWKCQIPFASSIILGPKWVCFIT